MGLLTQEVRELQSSSAQFMCCEQALMVRALHSGLKGRGFDSRPFQHTASCLHTCASVAIHQVPVSDALWLGTKLEVTVTVTPDPWSLR